MSEHDDGPPSQREDQLAEPLPEEEEEAANEEPKDDEEGPHDGKPSARHPVTPDQSLSSNSTPKTSSRSNRSTKTSSQRSTTRTVQSEPPSLPPEEIEAALDMLLHGVPPEDFDPDTLRACIESLKLMKKDAVAAGDYLQADSYAQLIKRSSQAADVASFSDQCSQKLNYFMTKQADAQDLVDSINEQWEQQFQEFEQTIQDKLHILTSQHGEEIEDFDTNVPDDLPPKYQKYSVELLLMRKKEHLLLRNEEYQDAHVVKQKADTLEAEELTQQQRKLHDDLDRQKQAILDKQKQQFNAFLAFVDERRRLMLRERDKALLGPVRRLEHYTRIVEKIEKKGIPPNPNDGFTTNRVNRKQAIKTLRSTAQTPIERSMDRPKRVQDPGPIPTFRPPSVITGGRTNKTGSSMSNRKSTGVST